MREKGFWYPLSKTSAEREAWRLVNDYNANHPDQKVRLISINPSFVIGPLLQSTLNTSSSILVEFLVIFYFNFLIRLLSPFFLLFNLLLILFSY